MAKIFTDGTAEFRIDKVIPYQLERNTEYDIGDIAYVMTLGAKKYLECTKGGYTSTEYIEIPNDAKTGSTYTDGAVTWVVKTSTNKEYVDNKIAEFFSNTSGELKGNASTASKLQTARTINVTDADGTNTGTGASFNGTANATVKLPATIKANLTGNAASATKATQDSDGNQINTTYLKRSGGTMTGDIDMAKHNIIGGTSTNTGIYCAGNDNGGTLGTTGANINIKSWYGVGFINGLSSSNTYNEVTVGIDVRKGIVHAKSFDGNATSATKLATARTINGVSFDGTKDITISSDAIESKDVSNPNAWWVKLKGGLIIQGGRHTTGSDAFSLPIAYPNAILSTVAIGEGTIKEFVRLIGYNKTSIALQSVTREGSDAGARPIQWISMGY